MKHVTIDQFISLQLEELECEDKKRVVEHLVICHSCSIAYSEFLELQAVWNDPSSFEPPNNLVDRVMDSLDEGPSVPKKWVSTGKNKSTQTWIHFMVSAAATIIVANMGLFQEIQHVSYQFIGGIVDATVRIETLTTSGSKFLEMIELDSIIQQIYEE
ncbi:hypothetical protein ACFSCX_10845 [Bacillus salitolerans]|uniref:Zinc-finger domain-containing protein n=1 Tax=Bacillus salitolerans TaxID=1437434 RepID=A0ABW4LQT4_9BACI